MNNWRYSNNISQYFGNGTRSGHSYNGRQIGTHDAIYRMVLFQMTLNDP